jgi:hypothetical protein
MTGEGGDDELPCVDQVPLKEEASEKREKAKRQKERREKTQNI